MDMIVVKDRILEFSSIARRVYGLKLLLTVGLTDTSRWFLLNKEKSKYSMHLKQGGLILDIGSFLGDYTSLVQKRNPQLIFWLFEPIAYHFNVCRDKFKDNENVTVYQHAVSADGRSLKMQLNGLRSKHQPSIFADGLSVPSRSIQEIFDSVKEVELMKMNIEGMEYECLEQLIRTKSLSKSKYLLIQFHNFEADSQNRRDAIRESLEIDYTYIFKFDWMWELWARKSN